MKNWKFRLKNNPIPTLAAMGAAILILYCLLFLSIGICKGQTFTQVSDYPYVVTQIKYDAEGSEYVIRQQGSLHKNGDVIKSFPVQFVNECGLVGLELYEDGFFLHISGQDSVQRVIQFDTVAQTLDTLLEVYYTAPYGTRHRGGGLFYNDSVLYCSFGYGFSPLDAQDLTDYRGKLLKINLNTEAVDIVAFGLRNPFRLDFNPITNDGFVPDPGTDIAEEINYFTGNYSLLNMQWPCFEGDSQVIVPDDPCTGFAYSSPEYTYGQDPDRAIIGGCFFNGGYYFTDHYTGFGGYLDTDWVLHELPIPFPAFTTSMAVNPVTNTLRVSTGNGDVFEYVEHPLAIDEDSLIDEDPVYPCRTCYNMYIDILGRQWSEPPVGIIFWAIRNSIVQRKLQYIFPD